jgi:phospholipase C
MKPPSPLVAASRPASSSAGIGRSVPRRHFIKQGAGLAAGLTLGRLLPRSAHAAARNKALPTPQRSGLKHIVVVMMENRSFDHLLGWLPGAATRPPGLAYPDRNGVLHPVQPLTGDYQGCGHPDPDHSYAGGRVTFNGGQCDGWLLAGSNDEYAIGYYQQSDVPFLGPAASAWTTCDRYFSSIMAGTFPNRIYQHAAQTDRLDNSLLPVSTLPTIWDRLAEHDISRRYYFSDFPFLALWGAKYLDISRPTTQFFADCQAGTLPAVSFVEPSFFGEAQGLSNDYHPHSDIRKGELFLNTVYEAVVSSPNWPNTVLVINFDEWGGFFDHVRPPVAAIPPADAALGSDGLIGFRVPALVVAPWAQRGVVAHDSYDHTSVLKMIEWRWNLRPLTVRDANANNLAEVLDFDRPNLTAPRFNVPAGPFTQLCISGTIIEREAVLGQFARLFGF